MKMKRIVFFALVFMAFGYSIYAQQLTVAVSPFEARSGMSKDDAETVTELFIAQLVADRTIRVVDRNNFDKIIAEMRFQSSDWADSNRVAELGRATGANSIIRGTVATLAGQTVITATILDINTAQILSSSTLRMANMREIFDKLPTFVNDIVTNLPNNKASVSPARPASGTYKIGDAGPAGGIVFYDKGTFSNGWRYLEAAPLETEFNAQWGVMDTNVNGTTTAIGTGKRNTEIIVGQLGISSAAGLCTRLNFNGFTDWFLPSKDELDLMYKNLKLMGWGGFGNTWYWSSSQFSNSGSWVHRFNDGGQSYYYKNNTNSVRAVRSF
jgi:TolB-like protein